MNECSKYVGLATDQDTIAVAVSEASGGPARYYGEIPNTRKVIAKLVKTNSRCRPVRPWPVNW
jgi:hypothetical protein